VIRVRDIFTSKRVALQLPMGFASGLPYLLTQSTLTTWMKDLKVDLTTVGAFSIVSLPYSLKFLWAPLVDRYQLPWLGRRRGWLLLFQVILIGVIALLGSVDPTRNIGMLAVMAVAVAFFSASQDILIDAYRADVLLDEERAAGVATYVLGYRLAMLVAGAGALILADHLPWSSVYVVLAGCMAIGIATTLVAAEPANIRPPRDLVSAVIEPVRDLIGRRGIVVVLAFVFLYRFGHIILDNMSQPFLLDIGFQKSEIGAVKKGLGLAAMITGGLVSGGLVVRLGIRRSLITFGGLAALIHLSYAGLAVVGKSHTLLPVVVAVDAFCTGLAIAPLDAYCMQLCNRRYSATQFALLTSFVGLGSRVVGSGSGWLAKHLGWPMFFVATLVLALPALILWFVLPSEEVTEPPPPAAAQ
jgi:PAT family beta-lactamase induction signal transducer AmpG